MANLATTSSEANLIGIPGRAVASARGHHVVVDSPPPLGGPNEEINPLDVLLSALATCAIFVCETVAQENEFDLRSARAHVEADFDPRGVRGEDVDPRLQAIRLRIVLGGVSEAQAETLLAALKKRCPVFTTLARGTSVEALVDVAQPDTRRHRPST